MSDAPKDGGRAFPLPEARGPDGCGIYAAQYGMSLRDWFAGQALTGLSSGLEDGTHWAAIAHDAYCIADAMLHARERKL